MSSETQRAEWRALAEAAPPGQWAIESGSSPLMIQSLGDLQDCGDYGFLPSWICNCGSHYDGDGLEQRIKSNAEFIAAARTAVPALLDDVKQLEEMVRELLAEKVQLRRQLAEHRITRVGAKPRHVRDLASQCANSFWVRWWCYLGHPRKPYGECIQVIDDKGMVVQFEEKDDSYLTDQGFQFKTRYGISGYHRDAVEE